MMQVCRPVQRMPVMRGSDMPNLQPLGHNAPSSDPRIRAPVLGSGSARKRSCSAGGSR
jgi:hypothetical protein